MFQFSPASVFRNDSTVCSLTVHALYLQTDEDLAICLAGLISYSQPDKKRKTTYPWFISNNLGEIFQLSHIQFQSQETHFLHQYIAQEANKRVQEDVQSPFCCIYQMF